MNVIFDINKVYALIDAYKSGRLGSKKMPEDENPALDKLSKENYLYFTLPMALNYRRNSYTLWECAGNCSTKVAEEKYILNDKEVVLRSARMDEAQMLIDYLKTVTGETKFLMCEPNEIEYTESQEEQFIKSHNEAKDALLIITLTIYVLLRYLLGMGTWTMVYKNRIKKSYFYGQFVLENL